MLWVISRHGLLQLLLDLQHLVAEQQPRLLVERGERLVHQQDLRLGRERARDRDALAHAAGQLRGIAALEAVRPTRSMKCVARSMRCALAMPAISSGKATFSITVRHGNVDSSWNTMPIEACGPLIVSPVDGDAALVAVDAGRR